MVYSSTVYITFKPHALPKLSFGIGPTLSFGPCSNSYFLLEVE